MGLGLSDAGAFVGASNALQQLQDDLMKKRAFALQEQAAQQALFDKGTGCLVSVQAQSVAGRPVQRE
jgi:hypothetical protein